MAEDEPSACTATEAAGGAGAGCGGSTGSTGAKAAAPGGALGLLEMPALWLHALVDSLPKPSSSSAAARHHQQDRSDSVRSLFLTCRALRDAVLASRTLNQAFKVPYHHALAPLPKKPQARHHFRWGSRRLTARRCLNTMPPKLHMDRRGKQDMATHLVRLSQLSARMHLTFQGPRLQRGRRLVSFGGGAAPTPECLKPDAARGLGAVGRVLRLAAHTLGGQGLTGVVVLTFQDMTIRGALMPSAIALACPNLQHLTVKGCVWRVQAPPAKEAKAAASAEVVVLDDDSPQPPSSPRQQQQPQEQLVAAQPSTPPASHLRRLTLHTLPVTNADGKTTPDTCKHARAQLAALPSLQELCLACDRRPEPMAQAVLVSASVTSLEVQKRWPSTDSWLPHLPTQFPALTRLSLWVRDARRDGYRARNGAGFLDDTQLEHLLNMPTLTHVCIEGLGLDQVHTSSPCGWKRLEVACLDLEQLARLPAQVVQPGSSCKVVIGCQSSTNTASSTGPDGPEPVLLQLSSATDPLVVSAMASAARHLPKLTRARVRIEHTSCAGCGNATFDALLALLRGPVAALQCQELTIGCNGHSSNDGWEAEELRAVAQALPASVMELRLEDMRVAAAGWEAMMAAVCELSQVHVVKVLCPSDIKWSPTPEALASMCITATRPIELGLELGQSLRDHEPYLHATRVLAKLAMENAGHAHVQLKLECWQRTPMYSRAVRDSDSGCSEDSDRENLDPSVSDYVSDYDSDPDSEDSDVYESV